MVPRGGERAGRLRAAVAYSGKKQTEAAKALSVSVTSLSRMENGRGTITPSDRQIADAFGVPMEFMEAGWAPLQRPIGDVERRLYEIEDRLTAIEATPPATDGRRKPKGELGRRAKGSEPSSEDRKPSANQKAAGSRRGTLK